MHQHLYNIALEWTGNAGSGTLNYKSYERSHTIQAKGKQIIFGSSDPAFRGNPTEYNPEELFTAALSSCHMLWYLHLCAVNNIVVLEYTDSSIGTMEEADDGSGKFSEVLLQPIVTVKEESMVAKANELHHEANKMCFLARSCNFPVRHKPEARVKD